MATDLRGEREDMDDIEEENDKGITILRLSRT